MADRKGKAGRPKRLTTADDQRPTRVPPTVERPGQRAAVQVPAPFTPEFFAEVNKGPLERAYEERQRDPKTWNPIPWGRVAIGVLIGLVFAYVNIFAALAVGITVGGSYYLTYFIGVAARWRPGIINYVAGASTGASQVVIGVAFVLPAFLFLSDLADPAWGFPALYTFGSLPSPLALMGFFLVGGLFGVLFFQFYRRLWTVERPLQYPGGFESTMELLGIASAERAEDREQARRSVRTVSWAAFGAGLFVLLRDLAFLGPRDARQSAGDALFGGRAYSAGYVPDLRTYRPFYEGFLFVDPFFLAIGWFIRTRIAGILLLGALLSYVLPFLDAAARGDAFALSAVWRANARIIAAGAIVGAGTVALIRLRGVIGSGFRNVFSPTQGTTTFGGLSKRLVYTIVGAGIVMSILLLILGGVPVGGALLVVPVATLLVGILGVIAVKVTGETSVQAVSPMTLTAILVLLLVLQLVGFSGAALVVLALGAAAFFATGVVMSTDVFLDTKVALYVGNPAHRQAWVQIAGLVPGIILGTLVVWFMAKDITATMDITGPTAPFGRIFAGLTVGLTGGSFNWTLFVIALGLGAMVELATGLGTAFGIGMALQLFAPVTIFLGALLRGAFERWMAGPREGTGAMVARIALPTGLFVGASLAALLVFVLGQFVL